MFVDGPGAGKHIQAGAKKVIITAPAKGADIPTYVIGVNEGDYTHDVANIVRLVLPISNTLLLTAKRLEKEKEKRLLNQVSGIIFVMLYFKYKLHWKFIIAATLLAPQTVWLLL